MGWFSSKEKIPDPVSRQDRQQCWDSRDAYFACLDGVQVLKPGDEGKACAAPKSQYEKDCARSWVSGQRITLRHTTHSCCRLNTSTSVGYLRSSSKGS